MNTQIIALVVMMVSVSGVMIGNVVRNVNELLGSIMIWGLITSTLISLVILVYQVMVGDYA